MRNRLAAAEKAFTDAEAKLQRHLIEGDIDADDRVRAKLETAVASCGVTRDGYAKALATQETKVADVEQKLATEAAAAARRAASEKMTSDLDQFAKALAVYSDAARGLTAALEPFEHWHYESGQMSRFAANAASQIEVAAGFATNDLRNTATAIANNTAPIPADRPVPEPIATIEPPPPTQTVFLMRSLHYRDHNGRKVFGGQYTDQCMPVATAAKAIRLNYAVSTADERRARLRGSRNGDHIPNAPDVIDLDAVEEHSGAHFVGPDTKNDVPLTTFVKIDRGPVRTGTITVPKF